jgi:hypothetical protein
MRGDRWHLTGTSQRSVTVLPHPLTRRNREPGRPRRDGEPIISVRRSSPSLSRGAPAPFLPPFRERAGAEPLCEDIPPKQTVLFCDGFLRAGASILTIVAVAALFFWLQRHLVRVRLTGAVKNHPAGGDVSGEAPVPQSTQVVHSVVGLRVGQFVGNVEYLVVGGVAAQGYGVVVRKGGGNLSRSTRGRGA